jgi:hypothetical protein
MEDEVISMSMTTGKIRLLIVGGMKKNVPSSRLTSACHVTHFEQGSRELKKGEITASHGNLPHIVLCFLDFIGHGESGTFKSKANTLGIPFAGAKGGFGALIEAARQVGVDLDPFLKTKPTPPPPKPKPAPPKEGVEAWIDDAPRHALERVVKGGFKVWAMVNRSGGHSVILKGDLLRDAVERAKKGNYGTGTRGALTPKEAEHIINALDNKYEFARRGINLSTATVIRNVGFVMGTLSDSVMKQMMAKTKGRRKKAGRKKGTGRKPTEMDDETKARQARKAELAAELKNGNGAPDNVNIEEFMGSMVALMQKMDSLYEKIVDLETQNATYIAEATALEADKNRLEKELEEANKEVAKLKRMVIGE